MFRNKRDPAAVPSPSPERAAGGNLHERVLVDLAQGFAGSHSEYSLGPSARADVVIRQGQRVAVVEIKTGDPELPLPSSTSSQMRLLARQARQKFVADGGDVESDVVPVLVTNYRVLPDDKKELEEEGIKVIPIEAAVSRYDPERFSRNFAEIVGLEPNVKA